MLRALLTPRWLGALVLAALFALASYHLGSWQWGRHLDKVTRNALLDANYSATPVPLEQVLDDAGTVREKDVWSRVLVRGRYDVDGQLVVRNRPNDGTYGYEVVVPLRTGHGVLAVDRGWVRNSPAGADVVPPIPDPPSGEVEVVGWVRQLESARDRDLPSGQISTISESDLVDAWPSDAPELVGLYLLMQQERPPGPEPTSGASLTPLAAPERSLGVHQAYAYQWWLSMPLGFGLVYFGLRRQVHGTVAVRRGHDRPRRVSRFDEEDY